MSTVDIVTTTSTGVKDLVPFPFCSSSYTKTELEYVAAFDLNGNEVYNKETVAEDLTDHLFTDIII